jgi:hypothetical protein
MSACGATIFTEAPNGSRVVLDSVITCQHCESTKTERMPVDACQIVYQCDECGANLRPKAGDCCVFCSYGSVRCPSMQTS